MFLHPNVQRIPILFLVFFLIAILSPVQDLNADELKIQREEVFDFTEKPKLIIDKKIKITFTTKAFCDVTIAIEDSQGTILRHLASGVLGENAPAPFLKNSKRQEVIWDGKDDRGKYLKELNIIKIRVSLGLKPQFEKTLNWSPHKRISDPAPLMAAAPEGMYVFDGQGVDHLRLFSHTGEYIKTIFPFPSNKIDKVVGLKKHKFIQDGKTLPLKMGFEQTALLDSGTNYWGGEGGHAGGYAATAMAVHLPPKRKGKRKIALVYQYLNRLTSAGDTGGLPLRGPKVCIETIKGKSTISVGPTSAAFSPDGKYLYMTGYMWQRGGNKGASDSFHVVLRIEYDKQNEPTVFVGQKKSDGGWGNGNDQFCVPTSVACDSKGRVYVADYVNNRIQVFSPEAKYLKSIQVRNPASLQVDPITGEITVASFRATGCSFKVIKAYKLDYRKMKPKLYKLGTFEKPIKPVAHLLPAISIGYKGGWISTNGQPLQMAVDFYHKEKTLWTVGRKMTLSVAEANWMGGGGIWSHLGGWHKRGIRLFTFKNEKWNMLGDFALKVRKKVTRVTPAQFSRQRLLVNPTDGTLFVIEEQTGAGKSFSTILKIDPKTGHISKYKLPHDCEDMLFDIDGLVYLKTDHEITRYDPKSWQQVNWDYGVERKTIRFSTSGSDPKASSMSALAIPGKRPGWYHSSGFGISPKGDLAVICHVKNQSLKKRIKKAKDRYASQGVATKYKPSMFEGRSGSRIIMVFNKHGNLIREDAAPGMTNADGINVDRNGSIYAMVAAPRVLDGKRYFNSMSETLIKFKPKGVKIISSSPKAPIPLSEEMKPKRKADLYKTMAGDIWVEGAEWFYGGVGYGGQGGSCTCWHSRFKLDYYARSFVPETRRYKVAVLDSNGNLILRMGKYGNVDDGKPIDSKGGPSSTMSIGGDEIALYHAAYLGVHSDRRLFIHDAGNARVLSVKLGYHTSETLNLIDHPDFAKLK